MRAPSRHEKGAGCAFSSPISISALLQLNFVGPLALRYRRFNRFTSWPYRRSVNAPGRSRTIDGPRFRPCRRGGGGRRVPFRGCLPCRARPRLRYDTATSGFTRVTREAAAAAGSRRSKAGAAGAVMVLEGALAARRFFVPFSRGHGAIAPTGGVTRLHQYTEVLALLGPGAEA